MRKFFYSFFIFFPFFIICQQSFTRMMTKDQINVLISSSDYAPEFNGGKCTRPPRSFGQKICKDRCKILYSYVPTARYKNLGFYNSTTKLCQSKTICPSIMTVVYNYTTNSCVDISTGSKVEGIDASPPNASTLINVTFTCQNGYVGIYNGLQDCICNFGYKTDLLTSFSSHAGQKYVKCNKIVKIAQYLPVYFQIYYDQFLDNIFPYALDPDYWMKALIYYLRQIKYSITTSIVPWQVQIVTIAIPTQPLIDSSSIVVLIWVSIPLFLIFLITCYQKLKNTRTLEQIAIKNEQQQNLEEKVQQQ